MRTKVLLIAVILALSGCAVDSTTPDASPARSADANRRSAEAPRATAPPEAAPSPEAADRTDSAADTPAPSDAQASPEASTPSNTRDDVGALESRVRELEALVARARASGGVVEDDMSPPTNSAGLMSLYEKRDAPALSFAIEELLLAGEPGFREVFSFYRRCDLEREKILDMTHDPQFIFAQLRVVARRPDAVAAFCAYLMDATATIPDSFIRREIFNFLPVFLNHNTGRYPELRERLRQGILHQLASGGHWLYKVRLAMQDIGFEPPVEAFGPVLKNPAQKDSHAATVEYIGSRGAAAVPLLVAFIESCQENSRAAGLTNAVRALEKIQGDSADGPLTPFLDHEVSWLRALAVLTYFQRPRPLSELSRIHSFLNSDASLSYKRRLVAGLRRKNNAIADALFADLTPITDPELRAGLERLAAAGRRRKP